jgi:ABC-type dipeptide/oligopeptide/nickel transport system permease subunit
MPSVPNAPQAAEPTPSPAAETSVPALMAPPPTRDNPLTRSLSGMIGMGVLAFMLIACLGSLFWTTAPSTEPGSVGIPRYNSGTTTASRLPPVWAPANPSQAQRFNSLVDEEVVERVAASHGISPEEAIKKVDGPVAAELREHWPSWFLGTDVLGRSLLIRVLTGGGISLTIGVAAALLSVFIGTTYGAIAGYAGGRIDAVMMRIVDVLYGLPYVLLVVLLAVAGDAMVDEYTTRAKAKSEYVREHAAEVLRTRGEGDNFAQIALLLSNEPALNDTLNAEAAVRFPARALSSGGRMRLDILTLLIAIGGVSWLTMARVVRGQVLSLKTLPFVEAARALGASRARIFIRHLLPNLMGPIVVYATLTVPQAILQESFLSFLGIGVKPPLPSWGNLAAEGLSELNPVQSNWWLLLFPCILLSATLLSLNFVGEGLREALDPKRARR